MAFKRTHYYANMILDATWNQDATKSLEFHTAVNGGTLVLGLFQEKVGDYGGDALDNISDFPNGAADECNGGSGVYGYTRLDSAALATAFSAASSGVSINSGGQVKFTPTTSSQAWTPCKSAVLWDTVTGAVWGYVDFSTTLTVSGAGLTVFYTTGSLNIIFINA